ncbi:MAG: NAD-dependent deacylase [Alphaproteobacteria bacterium]|nr:NAD-dependent deacylase [Alphaproteobacteria bacterium]
MPFYNNIVILTGAGISAESGLDTFRDKEGLWAKYDLMELATPEAFSRNPDLVHEFYNARRRQVKQVNSNAAHMALARMEMEYPGYVTIITQNVDDLHERAGGINLMHMHGELNRIRCEGGCGAVQTWRDDLGRETVCPSCGKAGHLRPHIVWFGEVPFHLEAIDILLRECDLFVSIGTSGSVYPAAGFVQTARAFGAKTVELNMEPTAGRDVFDEGYYGQATEIVPKFINELGP